MNQWEVVEESGCPNCIVGTVTSERCETESLIKYRWKCDLCPLEGENATDK